MRHVYYLLLNAFKLHIFLNYAQVYDLFQIYFRVSQVFECLMLNLNMK